MTGRVWALAKKDLLLLWRDKGAVFWVLGFPLIMAVLFGSIFSGMGPGETNAMQVALLDEDASPESKALLKELRSSKSLTIKTAAKGTTPRQEVLKGKLVAYIRVPKGFGAAQRTFGGKASPAIEIGIDPSRKAEAGFLQGLVTQASFARLQEQFSDPKKMRTSVEQSLSELRSATGMSRSQKDSLTHLLEQLNDYAASSQGSAGASPFTAPKVKVQEVRATGSSPKSSFEISFPQALIWALLGVVTTFAIGLVKERAAGTLLRVRVAPLSVGEILAGKGLACFLACFFVLALLLVFGALVFQVRLGNPLLLFLAIFSASVCFVGIMMLLSVMGKTEQSVAGSAWGVLIILAMFGGGMVPLIAMPGWMQSASGISPVKWSVLSIEGAIWRGFTLQDMFLPSAILLAVGAVCFYAGVRAFKLREA